MTGSSRRVSTFWNRLGSREAAPEQIRLTPEGLSRAQIASRLGISRAAVTSIAGDLIQRGLVRQASGRPSGGGRRGVLLELKPGAGGLLGIDIGASHVTMLLTDMAAHVLAEAEHSWPVARGPEACLENLRAMFDQLMDQPAAAGVQPVAIGVGVPGPVVTSQGMVSAPPIMPGWDGFPIRQRLEDLLGKPVALHNDADPGALGEWSFGAGREERDMV
jgi:hypothetical protein